MSHPEPGPPLIAALRATCLPVTLQAADEIERLREALSDVANRAVRIRENKAVVGIEASYIERIATAALSTNSSEISSGLVIADQPDAAP